MLYLTGIEHVKSMKNVPPYFGLIDEKMSWFDKKTHLYLKEFDIKTVEWITLLSWSLSESLSFFKTDANVNDKKPSCVFKEEWSGGTVLTHKTPDYQLGWAIWAASRLLDTLKQNFVLCSEKSPQPTL